MEIAPSPLSQNVQDDQTVYEDEKVSPVVVALAYVS
jgi:hypothetical protein